MAISSEANEIIKRLVGEMSTITHCYRANIEHGYECCVGSYGMPIPAESSGVIVDKVLEALASLDA